MNSATQTRFNNAERNRSAFFVARTCMLAQSLYLLASLTSISFQADAQVKTVYSADQIKQWIDQLENPSFLVRDQAKTRLKEAGELAFSQLYRARDKVDLEARLTIDEIISQIKIQWIGSGDSQRVIDLMLDFQSRRTEERLAIVDRLSWFSQEETWQPLYRITIYDKSLKVSSYAAGRLLQICFLRDERPSATVQRDYQDLSRQRYVAVNSLLKSEATWGEKMIAICFAMGKRTRAIIDVDDLLLPAVEIQNKTAKEWKASNRLSSPLRESLLLANRVLFQQAKELTEKSLSQEVMAGLDRASLLLVDKNSDTNDVVYVLNFLLKHSRIEAAEKAIELLNVDQDPWCGFWKAEILRRRGNKNEAFVVAQSVIQKLPVGNEEFADGVGRLTRWQLDFWIEYLLKRREDSISMRHALKLAELEFESENFAAAAKRAMRVFEQSESVLERLQSANLLAEIARNQERPKVELEWLLNMLKIDPLSTSALVELNRLAGTQVDIDSRELRQRLDSAKGAYRDQYRVGAQMAQSSTPAEANLGRVKMASAANSLAWLLFNLAEETQEASRMAEMAVQLEPRNSEFLDTLALGEFLFGNKERAVSLQKRAVFLSPGDHGFQLRLQKYRGRN